MQRNQKIVNLMVTSFFAISLTICCLISCNSVSRRPVLKQQSVFYSQEYLTKLRTKVSSNDWAAKVGKEIIQNAEPWMLLSDDQLWSLMFGNTISRSWMVWSNGYCPACKQSVPMYNWKIEPFSKPWKVQCPHCGELFPKNDFVAYYESGLDEHGIFDPNLADSSLLFNVDQPGKNDPLHTFGVDDGEGYVDGENRWRFIGAYLVYGQWKQVVLNGIRNLAFAYVVTGDSSYAHKAGILLDRVADLYPTFDYSKQGFTYEKQDSIVGMGYVSVWHDACEETRAMVLAYDMIFDAIRRDRKLVQFLSQKAKQFSLKNPKATFADIQENIEDRILRDGLNNRHKIESNFPRTDATVAIIEAVLSWPHSRERVTKIVNELIKRGTAVDGLSGEKGLAGYSALFAKTLAYFLSLFDRLDPDLLRLLFENNPNLKKTFRFHIDTWINEEYYPKVGDTGIFGKKYDGYQGIEFDKQPIGKHISTYSFTSMYSWCWRLYEITGDPVYVKILFKGNDNSVEGLPYDLFCDDDTVFQQNVVKVIQGTGTKIESNSINMGEWCLALLRSGQGKNSRTLWIDYDIGGNHCHADAMNIGLFAKGLDLLPGFGYPAVQFGGWHSPKGIWYKMTAAHNTVVVNGKNQMPGIGAKETAPIRMQLNPLKGNVRGRTTLRADGREMKAIRVTGPELYQEVPLQQYERTVALIDISEEDSYVLDVFRVVGGNDHARFMHGYFGNMITTGLSLKPISDYGFGAQMKNFRADSSPYRGWSATWEIRDYYHYLPDCTKISVTYKDLSTNVQAVTADTWVAFGFDNSSVEWIPSLMLRSQSDSDTLATTFTGIIEPYEKGSNLKAARRLKITSSNGSEYGDMNVAVQVDLNDGRQDLIIALDTENPLHKKPDFENDKSVFQPQWNFQSDAEFSWIRLTANSEVERIALANGSYVKVVGTGLTLRNQADFIEIEIRNDQPIVVAGNSALIAEFSINGNEPVIRKEM